MSEDKDNEEKPKIPKGNKSAKIARGALQAVGGAVPFAGGILSAIAGAWSEGEQEKINRFFQHWIRMCQGPCDYIPKRSYALFQARAVLKTLAEEHRPDTRGNPT